MGACSSSGEKVTSKVSALPADNQTPQQQVAKSIKNPQQVEVLNIDISKELEEEINNMK